MTRRTNTHTLTTLAAWLMGTGLVLFLAGGLGGTHAGDPSQHPVIQYSPATGYWSSSDGTHGQVYRNGSAFSYDRNGVGSVSSIYSYGTPSEAPPPPVWQAPPVWAAPPAWNAPTTDRYDWGTTERDWRR